MTGKLGYGELLRAARDLRDWNQTEAAEALGLESHSDVSRLENENRKTPITPELFDKLLGAYPELTRVQLVEAMGFTMRLPDKLDGFNETLFQSFSRLDLDSRHVVLVLARSLRERPIDWRSA